MSRRILVTGALGYVGGRIARYLSGASGCELFLSSRRDIQRPAWLVSGDIVRLDVLADDPWSAVQGMDQIIHLAAVNEIESAASPEKALSVNGVGTIRLLNAAVEARVKRFVYFSTAHVYGAPLAGTISETTLPRPIHPYAITHRTAEDFVLAEHSKGTIEGVVIRLSNGFGAPERPGVDRWTLLVNDLCRQAVTTHRLVLRSSGVQLRDFVTLHDVARGTEHFLNVSRESLQDGLFNLGGAAALSVFDVTEVIRNRCQALFGFMPQLVRPSTGAGERVLSLDYRIDKLKATGFELRGDMVTEIDDTLRICQAAFAGELP